MSNLALISFFSLGFSINIPSDIRELTTEIL